MHPQIFDIESLVVVEHVPAARAFYVDTAVVGLVAFSHTSVGSHGA